MTLFGEEWEELWLSFFSAGENPLKATKDLIASASGQGERRE